MKLLITGFLMLILCGTAFGQRGVTHEHANGGGIIPGRPMNGTVLHNKNDGTILGGPSRSWNSPPYSDLSSGWSPPPYNDMPYYQRLDDMSYSQQSDDVPMSSYPQRLNNMPFYQGQPEYYESEYYEPDYDY